MTKAYLRISPNRLFWQCLLGIPFLIWMYSVVFELNKKLPKYRILYHTILIGLVGYIIFYWILALYAMITGNFDFEIIFPFHVGAFICSFCLMILVAQTIVRFEKMEKLKPSNVLVLFLGLWIFIFGVWEIQPKLNKYIERIN